MSDDDHPAINVDQDAWDDLSEQTSQLTVINVSESFLRRLETEQGKDNELKWIIAECCMAPGVTCYNHELDRDDGILKVRDMDDRLRLAIPTSMIEEVISTFHEGPHGAHRRRDETYAVIRNRFSWPNMYKDVADWVKSCITCNRVKPSRPIRNGLLSPIVTTHPFEMVGVDIVGPFSGPTGRPDKYILVAIDLFTSWVEAATMMTLTAQETCDVFFSLVVSRHGCPRTVICDMGSQFKSKLFAKLCDNFNIQRQQVATMHQQANGKAERFIGFLVKTMATLVKEDHSDWDRVIDSCLLVYRVSVSRSLGDSPFYLTYGRDPVLPQDVQMELPTTGRNNKNVSVEDFRSKRFQQVKDAFTKLMRTKEREQADYKRYYDAQHKHVDFTVGSLVMVYFHTPKVGVTLKLIPAWDGPFRVLEKVSSTIFKVKNLEDHRTTTVHVDRLRPYKPWKKRLPTNIDSSKHNPPTQN